MSQGMTEAEGLDNIKDALALRLGVRREDGLPLTVPVETREVEVAVDA